MATKKSTPKTPISKRILSAKQIDSLEKDLRNLICKFTKHIDNPAISAEEKKWLRSVRKTLQTANGQFYWGKMPSQPYRK